MLSHINLSWLILQKIWEQFPRVLMKMRGPSYLTIILSWRQSVCLLALLWAKEIAWHHFSFWISRQREVGTGRVNSAASFHPSDGIDHVDVLYCFHRILEVDFPRWSNSNFKAGCWPSSAFSSLFFWQRWVDTMLLSISFLIMVTVGEEIWMFFGLSGESSSARRKEINLHHIKSQFQTDFGTLVLCTDSGYRLM